VLGLIILILGASREAKKTGGGDDWTTEREKLERSILAEVDRRLARIPRSPPVDGDDAEGRSQGGDQGRSSAVSCRTKSA
jgi:hypothetical protein